MKAKHLEIETAAGCVTMENVIYHFLPGSDVLEIHWSFFITSRGDCNKIIETQLRTGRDFLIEETENGYNIVFNYPYYLVRALF